MYSSVFTAALLTLLPTSLARPTTAPPLALPTTLNFTVLGFYASIASPEGSQKYQLQSWATFDIHDGSYETLCSAISKPNEQIYSDYKYWPCDVDDQNPNVRFSFRISKDFKELVVKKSWDNKGIWLTGFATQETDWNEGKDGNVTAQEYGKFYTRSGEWEFEITRLIG
ncbi:Nn.00g032890.m01.CDS01 [Neocucurbitaria sp. VM-36]